MGGTSRSRKLLWQLAEDKSVRGQALICLCFIANPADLPALVQELETTGPAARSMPYHLYRAYGKDVLPHIERAAEESPNDSVRKQCLKVLEMSKRTAENVTAQPGTKAARAAEEKPKPGLIGTWVKQHTNGGDSAYPGDADWDLEVTFRDNGQFVWRSTRTDGII